MARDLDLLAIDDEPSVLKSLVRALGDLDLTIETTTDPHAAFEILENARPRVLVTDFRMPVVDGVGVLRAARRLSPETVRILLTAQAGLPDVIDAINEGRIFRFVTKPWENDQLVGVIQEALLAYRVGTRPVAASLDAERERTTLHEAVAAVRTAQRARLPAARAAGPGPEIACWSAAYEHATGDCVDTFGVGPGRTAVLIGDVAGHGLQAALFGFAALTLLRSSLADGEPLAVAVGRANRAVCRDFIDGRFLTLFAGIHDERTGSLEYINAGHVPPLLWDGRDIRELEGTALPLGLVAHASYDVAASVPLGAGATLFACTDGLPEARDTRGSFFGLERVRELLRGRHDLPADALLRSALDLLAGFVGGPCGQDDLTLLVFRAARVTAPAAPR